MHAIMALRRLLLSLTAVLLITSSGTGAFRKPMGYSSPRFRRLKMTTPSSVPLTVTVTAFPYKGTFREGMHLIIVCNVYGVTSKTLEIDWTVQYRYVAPFRDSSRVNVFNFPPRSYYVISKATKWDSGVYTCHAEDNEIELFHSGSLVLTAQGSPSLYSHSATVKEGERAVLRCTGKKFFLVSWRFQGRLLQNDSVTKITGPKATTLVIDPVSCQHSGTYECKATIDPSGVYMVNYTQLTVDCPLQNSLQQPTTQESTTDSELLRFSSSFITDAFNGVSSLSTTASEDSIYESMVSSSGNSPDVILTDVWSNSSESNFAKALTPISSGTSRSQNPQPTSKFSFNIENLAEQDANVSNKNIYVLIIISLATSLGVTFLTIISLAVRKRFRSGTYRVSCDSSGKYTMDSVSSITNRLELLDSKQKLLCTSGWSCQGSNISQFTTETTDILQIGNVEQTPSGELVESADCPFSGSRLTMEVGPEGCVCQRKSISFSIPPGALASRNQITVQYCTKLEQEQLPPEYSSPDWFWFSPVLMLAPHGLQFFKPVSVRFPVTANRGWILVLLRADCNEMESPTKWSPVLVINTDSRQTTFSDGHCSYNMDTDELALTHFCKYSWCGRHNIDDDRSEKEMICALFVSMNWLERYCLFVLYFLNRCDELLESATENESRRSPQCRLADSAVVLVSREEEPDIEIKSSQFDVSAITKIVFPLQEFWTRSFSVPLRQQFTLQLTGSISFPEVSVKVSAAGRSEELRAVFPSTHAQTLSQCSIHSGSSVGSAEYRRNSVQLSHTSGSSIGDVSADGHFGHCTESARMEFETSRALSTHDTLFVQGHSLLERQVSPSKGPTSADVVPESYPNDDMMVTGKAILAACSVGCERQDWVKIGAKLLGMTDAKVRNMFTDISGMQTNNSEKLETILNKWKDRDGAKATIGKLRAALHSVNKCAAFDQL